MSNNQAQTKYNPSVNKPIGKVYRPWYIIVTLLAIIVGAALIALGILMKIYDSKLSWMICHIWTGIPLFVGGFLTIGPCASRSKRMAVFYMMFMFAVMVACAAGAIINGLEYWMQYWEQTKLAVDKGGVCKVIKGVCQCSNVIKMPSQVDDCENLKYIVYFMIGEIAANAAGFMVSCAAVFLSFMSVCCGPWVYLESYKRENDPDFVRVQMTSNRPH